jgi:transposase-like protein
MSLVVAIGSRSGANAVYVATGVPPEGEREVPEPWIANNEGARFWLPVMNNLRNRGVEDAPHPVLCIWYAIR